MRVYGLASDGRVFSNGTPKNPYPLPPGAAPRMVRHRRARALRGRRAPVPAAGQAGQAQGDRQGTGGRVLPLASGGPDTSRDSLTCRGQQAPSGARPRGGQRRPPALSIVLFIQGRGRGLLRTSPLGCVQGRLVRGTWTNPTSADPRGRFWRRLLRC